MWYALLSSTAWNIALQSGDGCSGGDSGKLPAAAELFVSMVHPSLTCITSRPTFPRNHGGGLVPYLFLEQLSLSPAVAGVFARVSCVIPVVRLIHISKVCSR